MGKTKKDLFIKAAEQIAFDETHRKTIQFNMGKYHAAVANGKLRYRNLEAARQRAADIKRHTLENLPRYLREFEEKFSNNGGKVLWARSARMQ
jgi:L-lactate dehydrogenase complex protein LldF